MNCCMYRNFLVCVLTLFAVSGCGPRDLSEVELPIPKATETVNPLKETKTVEVTNTNATSPAFDNSPLPGDGATPEEVCERFLIELNRENPDQYRMLFTPAALTVTSRLDFDLPPIADSNAEFELSGLRFASIRKKVCFVDSRVANSENDSEKVTWMLRKSKFGWRIAGMLVPDSNEEVQNLLSFESSTDVGQIRDNLTSEVGIDAQSNASN